MWAREAVDTEWDSEIGLTRIALDACRSDGRYGAPDGGRNDFFLEREAFQRILKRPLQTTGGCFVGLYRR